MNDLNQDPIPEVNIVQRCINIDSRDRNKRAYVNTNDYVINLKEALFSVKKIELVSAEIPKSEYFVDETNNLLEILIDPVLFANRAPTGYTERLIPHSHVQDKITVMRVDSSQTNGHGIIDILTTLNENVKKVSSNTFNASRTSNIDLMVLSEIEQEVLFVASYSEDDDNFSGNCRFVILKYNGVSNASFSFGSEFTFETLNNLPSSVFDKRMCSLTDNKFALVYNKENTSANLLVGSVGTNVNDTDGRLSNSNLVNTNVAVYSSCPVDSTKSFVVYYSNNTINCKLITIYSDFSLNFTPEIQIDEQESVHLSCDCMNKRILVSSVNASGIMKIYVLLIIDGPDLILINSSLYSIENSYAFVNASSSRSFFVDPNSIIKWTSDVFNVINLYVRRIGQNIAISSRDSSTMFPLLQLQKQEYHRVTLMAHPLDPTIPDTTIQSVTIFTSQIQNIEYSNMRKESSSILLYVDSSVNTLFYGIQGQSTRGVINIVALTPDYTLPFSIFVSGVHDVGNKPFTFRATDHAIRSLRNSFQCPGPNVSSLGKTASVNGTGFLFHESSELWSIRDGKWSLMSTGGAGNNETPGPRDGAVLTNNGKTIYLFGGISTSRSSASAFETPYFSVLPSSPTSYVLKNLKNSNTKKIFFYDVIEKSDSERTSFASIADPSVDTTGWSGLNDVSSFFEKNTFGFTVNSFNPGSATYILPNSGVNPTGYEYQLELLVYPLFESIDISGTLQITQNAELQIQVYESPSGPLRASQSYSADVNKWSNLSLLINTSSWSISDLQDMEIRITCSNIFMKKGICAIRDPELFVLNYELPVDIIDVELYFTNVKQNPKTSSFQLYSETFDTDNIFMNDLWSIVAEPFFSMLIFSLLRSDQGVVTDRCQNIDPELVGNSISNAVLTTTVSNVSEGPSTFSDSPSMMFSGINVFTLPSSGASIRANTTGDFTFSCTIEPRICKSILSIDLSSTGLVVNGEKPSHVSSINVSNSLPSIYQSGQSLIFDQSSVIVFPILIPGEFVVNTFLYVPSSASGPINLMKIGNLMLRATDNDLLTVNSLSISFPRNQWIHVSWMGNGMAMKLIVDNNYVTSLLARDTVESFEIGGGGFSGTVLLAGLNVCTPLGNKGLDYLTLLSEDHKHGHLPDNLYTIMSCGINTSDLRLFIDCTGTQPLLSTSLLNQMTQQVLPEGVVDVCMGRENGVIRLFAGSTASSVTVNTSTSLLLGDVRIGGRQGFNENITQTYCGAADDIKMLIGRFDEDSNVHVIESGLRTRSMIWKSISYVSNTNNVISLEPRAHGSLTMDSASPPNLWLFGGEGINGCANDLWQITTGVVKQAYNISGSSICSGPIDQSTPGSRSHVADYNDGQYVYIFGGETGPSVGPLQFTGTVTKLYNQSGSETLRTGTTPFWEGSVIGSLYPVFTKNTAVLLDSTHVVWAEVSDGINTFFLFLFPEEDQSASTINAFVRTSDSTLPLLTYDDHVNTTIKSALPDFWRYSINTASWELLAAGSRLRSETSPGVRSKCNIHYDGVDTFYLLPGQSNLDSVYAGQDLWSISNSNNWQWNSIRIYSTTSSQIARSVFSEDCRPGAAPNLYWRDNNNIPNLWTTSGRVFINQLKGEIEERNLHYCIAINSEFISTSDQGARISFVNRLTLDASTTYPGILDVDSLTSMGDGCFLITTSKYTFAELSFPTTSVLSYDPTQLVTSPLEVVETLPTVASGPFQLIKGVKYEFRSVQSSEISVSTTQELQGVSVIANEQFSITVGSLQFDFNVISFNQHSFMTGYQEPQQIISLQSFNASNIIDVISSSAVSNYSTSVVESNVLGAKFRFSYQNQLNNRYGEVSTVYFDRLSGNFSLLNNIVVSSSNPTTNISSFDALFDHTIVMFSDQNGTHSIVCNDDQSSPSTMQSTIVGSNIEISVLNHFQTSVLNTEWMIFFIFNNNLRVCAQQTTSNQLTAPVQNLVGETIRYSHSFTLENFATQAPNCKVRICRLESGELNGEIVSLYSTGSSLVYKDAVVSNCDPLNTTLPPSTATQTFSLVSQVNLVSTSFSDFEVISLSSIDSTNFIVFFLSADSLSIRYRIYVREAGSYLSGEEMTLFTFPVKSHFVKVEKATGIYIESGNNYHLHFIVGDHVKILYVTWTIIQSNPISSTLSVISTLNQYIDNTDPIKKASSVFTSNQVVTFTVHESTSTQTCAITARTTSPPLPSQDIVNQVLERRSFKSRITHGDYNLVSSFVDEIKNELLKNDLNFDCIYDNATTKIAITNEFSVFTILLSKENYNLEDESASNGLGYILGFRDFNDVVSQFDGSVYRSNSTNRIDLFGRQYLYLFLSTPDGPISSEATSRNKENAFGRIILSVKKGETMFFTSNLYEVFADVSIPVVSQLRVKLVRFAQINNELSDSKDLFMYQPQGMEHSFSLKIHCALDKIGSGKNNLTLLTRAPVFPNEDTDTDSDDDGYG